jgi:hypothetical protein
MLNFVVSTPFSLANCCKTRPHWQHVSLVETSTIVYGRKIPLADIIMAENQRLLIEISRSSSFLWCYLDTNIVDTMVNLTFYNFF